MPTEQPGIHQPAPVHRVALRTGVGSAAARRAGCAAQSRAEACRSEQDMVYFRGRRSAAPVRLSAPNSGEASEGNPRAMPKDNADACRTAMRKSSCGAFSRSAWGRSGSNPDENRILRSNWGRNPLQVEGDCTKIDDLLCVSKICFAVRNIGWRQARFGRRFEPAVGRDPRPAAGLRAAAAPGSGKVAGHRARTAGRGGDGGATGRIGRAGTGDGATERSRS